MSNSINEVENKLFNKITGTYNNVVIKDSLKLKFSNPKVKISEEAVELISELAKIITVEAAMRAAKQCKSDNQKNVNLSHVENTISKLIIDLP